MKLSMSQTSKVRMASKSSSTQHLHIALFPFMSKGHIIPLLHLTKLIHNHRSHATFTIFTTPANQPFISASLSSLPPDTVNIICLPFSATNHGIPLGVESTHQLSSMSLFPSFALSTINLQTHFETALENLQKSPKNPISFLVSDGFLYWTQESASKFNINRLAFTGMSMYSSTISIIIFRNRLFSGIQSKAKGELVQVPEFPWIRVSKDDLPSFCFASDPQDPELDFVIKSGIATSKSYGSLINSFYQLEQPFVDYANSKLHFKSWCVGPFCLAEKPTLERSEKPEWIMWLDQKLAQGKPVLYVAFGSQVEISNEQLKEISIGLEKSRANFVWALRINPNQEEVLNGFEEKVKDKGLLIRSWVEQREILEHEAVQGFLSHCGWNSTIESVCAGVPILAWPMIAEQHLNARMVVEEIKVGLRVETCDGSSRGFVKWEGLSKMVKELMEGEMGIKARKKVKELSEVAKKCVEEGGSSWCNLETLLNELEMGPIITNR